MGYVPVDKNLKKKTIVKRKKAFKAKVSKRKR